MCTQAVFMKVIALGFLESQLNTHILFLGGGCLLVCVCMYVCMYVCVCVCELPEKHVSEVSTMSHAIKPMHTYIHFVKIVLFNINY